MAFPFLQRKDFWRVSSYSYPNPFSDNAKSKEAWITLASFYDHTSYDNLKNSWNLGTYGRTLSHQAVESWKATFEEFGLLYVLSGSDQIVITPAGRQFHEAVENKDPDLLEWIGLNLLIRYPLKGPRRPKSPLHGESDLLLYRYLFSAILDLEDILYWTEVERVLSKVFFTSEATSAIQEIKKLRENPAKYSTIQMPIVKTSGAFYNSLNQIIMHASMGYVLLGSAKNSIYGSDENPRTHSIFPDKKSMIRRALFPLGATKSHFSSELMVAPSFPSQGEYFEYLGQKVNKTSVAPETSIPEIKTEQVAYRSVSEFKLTTKQKTSTNKRAGSSKKRTQRRHSKQSKLVGDHGEKIVMAYEQKKLLDAGQKHLISKIVHEADIGNTPGWDITSFDENGHTIYIEVKSSLSATMPNFSMTSNEWSAARLPSNRERYYIYLVYEVFSPLGAQIKTLANPYGLVRNKQLSITLDAIRIIL